MTLLPVAEALRRILASASPTPAEEVAVAAAAGRTLAAPLLARLTQPPFAASAMDGYAVRSGDATVGARLRVVGESAAGHRFAGAVGPGEAVRIFTGAPVPAGADTILVQENTRREGNMVEAIRAPLPGRHLRPAGLDFRTGAELLPAGRQLGPRELSLAAASGVARLSVRRRPRVALLSAGDELVPPGGAPGRDQIIASSALGLVSLAAGCGAEPIDFGIVPDKSEAIAALAARAAAGGVDVLVTIGGASVGARDLVRPALTEAGMSLDFWRIAMRPGRPLIHGQLGEMAVLGLPGSPVSSLVCAILFLRPLIGALLGQPRVSPRAPAVLGMDMPATANREEYLRARIEPNVAALPRVTPFGEQDSGTLSALAAADCLLIRPANAAAAPTGTPCEIIWL